MSAKAGTIQGTQNTVSTGAWIAAILVATAIVVALFAMNRSSETREPATTTAKLEATVPVGFSHVAPITAKLEATVPVGFSHVAPTTGDEPWQPIDVNGSACNQCR